MRLKLHLHVSGGGCVISFNYGYYLSSAIYRWIEASSPEYSTFLHDHGFHVEGTARRFKHFCFSQLIVLDRRIADGRLHILSPTVVWYVSMPVEASLQHLVVGMFEKREFYIGSPDPPDKSGSGRAGLAGNRFVIEQVETLPDPQWKSVMKFRMLSPLTVSVPEDRNGRLVPRYLQAGDERLTDSLRKNILNKYRSLYCRSSSLLDPQTDTTFRCTLDEKFIASRGGPEKISKLITIKQGREDETKVRGFMCPITIEGNPELIKLAYESGLGEKNSMGFGMLEVV